MNDVDRLALLLIALNAVDWVATVVIVRYALILGEPALEERATVSVILTLGATGIAVLSAMRLLQVQVDYVPNLLLLAMGLVALSVPQIVWSLAFLVGRFK